MQLYNTKTHKKEEFMPLNGNKVTIYFCGPTLYSDIHIGNGRPIITFDILSRYLTILGYEVEVVSNITDIDDKIITVAKERGITETELVEENYQKYQKIKEKLKLLPLSEEPKVTEYIKPIILYITNLIDLGYAYESAGSVYFRVEKVKEYGILSNHKLEKNDEECETTKENSNDFALWKKTNSGIMWESPWGKGRPGWHTECVVMIDEIFQTPIDIHGGGNDLMFPHHENENVQAKAQDKELANFWIHNGFVNLDGEKMSKSVGNIINIETLLKTYSANFFKLLFAQSSYQQPLTINDDVLKQVKKQELKIEKIVAELEISKAAFTFNVQEKPEILQLKEYLDDNLNYTNALDYALNHMKNSSLETKARAWQLISQVLGLEFVVAKEEVEVPANVMTLIDQRITAKKEKDYELADEIRKEINELGFEIKDTKAGVEIKCLKK